MRYGLSEPAGQMVPRYIFTARSGPVPLSALLGVAGKVDPQTGAPDPRQPLPHEAFTGVQGAIPNPPLTDEPLAEQEYGPSAIPPAPPPQPLAIPVATDPNAPKVAKEAAGDGGAPAAGISSDTGIYGYDGPGERDEDDHIGEDEAREAVAKAELAAFSRFTRARRKAGAWRDFEFAAVSTLQAHRLNDAGRLAVRKAAGEIAVAGLAVLAADTGRVLMLQRALCDDDPAGGKFEVPGGHLEGTDTPRQAALREFQEESGLMFPDGEFTATWTSANGIYQGFVYTIPCEDGLDIFARQLDSDPDGDVDGTETIAWWNPADLPGNPAVRDELLADIDAVMAALGCGQDDCCGAECCSGGCCDGSGGCTCGPAGVAKAGDESRPKVLGPSSGPAGG
jgi:ADP-ribose pyrophosphatase YjhB (NUDIX family)